MDPDSVNPQKIALDAHGLPLHAKDLPAFAAQLKALPLEQKLQLLAAATKRLTLSADAVFGPMALPRPVDTSSMSTDEKIAHGQRLSAQMAVIAANHKQMRALERIDADSAFDEASADAARAAIARAQAASRR